jgi:phosphatidylserine decarboxylase
VLVCPADGKIVHVEQVKDESFGYRVAIFLSPLDVHVNWMPLSGKIQTVQYRKGSFAMAFLPKSSELNERNDVLLQTDSDTLVRVRQIAGTIARKIVCWVREGEQVRAGQSFGMIKFGSRVELFLPPGTEISVQEGQRVYGGQTVLGKLQ